MNPEGDRISKVFIAAGKCTETPYTNEDGNTADGVTIETQDLVFKVTKEPHVLTERKGEIISHVIDGEMNKEIAVNLKIKIRTVKNQIAKLQELLGYYFMDQGLNIQPPSGRIEIILSLLYIGDLELQERNSGAFEEVAATAEV